MRTIPLTGSDSSRVTVLTAFPGAINPGEIHTTSDQLRLFLQNQIIAPVFQGEVSDEAQMLAKNTVAERGVFPGDFVSRADTATVWLCISNRGADLADWFEFPKGVTSVDADVVTYDPTASGLTTTDVQAALDELAGLIAALPPPPDAADVPFDNTGTGMSSHNVQDAIEELNAGGGGGGTPFDVRDGWLFI